MSRRQWPIEVWASVVATRAAQDLAMSPGPGMMWICGAARALQVMVERNGYTREAAEYEMRTGLGLPQ